MGWEREIPDETRCFSSKDEVEIGVELSSELRQKGRGSPPMRCFQNMGVSIMIMTAETDGRSVDIENNCERAGR